ncbi:MAG: hypothetical protein ABH871_07020 [Pseudomonadota bacterium]
MPTLNEFIANFGIKEILLTLFIIAVIVVAREHECIFRRNKR